jgi:TetR/AcrR family transcriptional regulator, cholesterol catabolism regulator
MEDWPELDPRTERIIEVAVQLAERDGYDAVRLRDVASLAEVALGTVYRRFSCKEDILAAALELQVRALAINLQENPVEGDTPQARVLAFFSGANAALGARPKLTGAMLRTVASGVPELVQRVARYREAVANLILTTWLGPDAEREPTEHEQQIASLLQDVWFAALVGWTGGLHPVERVNTHVRNAIDLLSRGLPTP